MEIYRKIESSILAILNWVWKVFIIIHECKNIFNKRSLYKNVKLTSEQKEQIDVFYKKYYGKRIPYWWHRLYMSYTGKFDYRYMPEYIYTTKLEIMNNRRNEVLPLENKNMFSEIFKDGQNIVKQPEVILMSIKGKFFDEERNIISEQEAVEKLTTYNAGKYVAFIKVSIDTSSGRGVRLLDMEDGIDKIKNEDIRTILKNTGTEFVVQKKVIPHEKFSTLYKDAVNTLRIVTYMTKNEIKIAPIAMRIGQGGSVVDNSHAGGMSIGVTDDGRLLREAFTEHQDRYTIHPDSGVIFEGYQIPCVPEIRKAAIKLHKKVPMFQFVSWDFTVDAEEKIVLIEANLHSQSLWFPQYANGKSMFGEDTAELLCSCKRKKL